MMKQTITALGIMSGTSLDGLDLALCTFSLSDDGTEYEINKAATIPYTSEFRNILSGIHQASAVEISLLNVRYGEWIGEQCRLFLEGYGLKPQLIASHGHTVFHQPENRFTLQIGSGAAIAAVTGITTISDFRSLDVALGGQGAPLVPLGDRLLFGSHAACINLGGFANISFPDHGRQKAFDICPANIILNRVAAKLGYAMDESGHLAASGTIHPILLENLNMLPFYRQTGPRSLGREWTETQIIPLLEASGADPVTLLCTFTEHIAMQTAKAIPHSISGTAIITGGGAHNTYLISRIQAYTKTKLHLPDKLTIDFKEALIFALLGTLRFLNRNNCLAEVTGAAADSSGGAIYLR